MLQKLKQLFKQEPQRLIEVRDEKGHISRVSEQEWKTVLLPKEIKKSWDNAQKLSDHIAYALQDGYAELVEDATERLLEIDILPERSYVLRAITLSKLGKYAQADALLTDYHAKFTKTGASLINHAKIAKETGDATRAEALLLEGLSVDPNIEEGIEWYSDLLKERFGNEGYKKALEHICSIKNSWRAYLWLGRYELQQNNSENALRVYNNYFRLAEERDRALLMLSADLGQHNMLKDMVELVAVQYIPDRHDVRIGFNLLKAYHTLGLDKDLEILMNQLRVIDRIDVQEELNAFEKEIAQ